MLRVEILIEYYNLEKKPIGMKMKKSSDICLHVR